MNATFPHLKCKKDAWLSLRQQALSRAGAACIPSRPSHRGFAMSAVAAKSRPRPRPKAGGKRVIKVSGNGSLHGEVLSRLRDYVVEGSLADGERIPEKQLCEMFGIS